MLGEIWYAEADSPVGPWVYATKIVTHDKYSFYNPKHHPMFDQEGGRLIFFEGTYTHTFSGNEHRTPRYDYNQIMYRLDLADERLALPVAVYDTWNAAEFPVRPLDTVSAPLLALHRSKPAERADVREIAFFASTGQKIARSPSIAPAAATPQALPNFSPLRPRKGRPSRCSGRCRLNQKRHTPFRSTYTPANLARGFTQPTAT